MKLKEIYFKKHKKDEDFLQRLRKDINERRILQAKGRGRRHVKDYCVILELDHRYRKDYIDYGDYA